MNQSSSDESPKTEAPTLDTDSRQPTNDGNVTVEPQVAVEPSNLEPPREDENENEEENGGSAVSQQLASESEFFKPQPAADANLVFDATDQLTQDALFDDSEKTLLDRPGPEDQHFRGMPAYHGPFEIVLQHRDGRKLETTKIACFFNLETKTSNLKPSTSNLQPRTGDCVVALTVFHLLTDRLYPVVYKEIIQNERLSLPKHIKDILPAILARENLTPFLFGTGLSCDQIKESVKLYITILNQLLYDGTIECRILQEHGRNNTFKLKGSSFRYALPYSDTNTNFDAVLVELSKLNGDPLDPHDMEALKHEKCGADIYKVVDCEEFSHEKAREHSEIHPDQLKNTWSMKGNPVAPVNLQSGLPIQDLNNVPLFLIVPGDKDGKIMQFVFKHGSSITNVGDSGRGIFIYGKSGSKHFNIVAMMTHVCKNSPGYSYCQSVHMLVEQFIDHESEISGLGIIGKLDTPTDGS